MNYRANPVIVDAIQFMGFTTHRVVPNEILEFCHDVPMDAFMFCGEDLAASTSGGYVRVSPRDFIIRCQRGKYVALRPLVFNELYEACQYAKLGPDVLTELRHP